MDVTCDRCKTRYEFDAALVSSRGTTVKCTNCNHQFRVFRPAGSGGLSGWTVRRSDGSELRFLAMRELQTAISSGNVSEADTLVPDDGSTPQRLGDIEELRSFFRAAPKPQNPLPRPPETAEPLEEHDTTKRHRRDGGGATAAPASGLPAPKAPPPNRLIPATPAPTSTAPMRDAISIDAPNAPTDDIDMLETNPQLPRVDLASLHAATIGSTAIGFAAPSPPKNTKKPSTPPETSSAPPASDAPYQGPDLESDVKDALDRVSIAIRESIPPRDSDEGVLGRSKPKSSRPATPPRTPSPKAESDEPANTTGPSQDDAEAFDDDGARASIEAAGSRYSVARPSVLRRTDGGDPRFSEYGRRSTRPGFGKLALGVVALGAAVLVGVTTLRKLGDDSKSTTVTVDDARVARFLDEGEASLLGGDIEGAKVSFAKASGVADNEPRVLRALARVALVEADAVWLKGRASEKAPEDLPKKVERAKMAVAAVTKAMPDDASTAPLRIDALRLEGKLTEARALVPKVGTTDPMAGRALAALDLCEATPSWDPVVDRLRTAVSVEQKLAQAQAMLVFALAKKGDVASAKREVDKLAEVAPSHPALAALKDLVGRAGSGADTGEKKGATEETIDVEDTLKRARAALKRWKYGEAEKLFAAVVEHAPNDADGWTGLGDVSRAKNDRAEAEKRYLAALERHPKHAPALVGLGELKWSKNERDDAVELFKKAVDAAPGSTYAELAKRRIAEAEKPSSGTTKARPVAPPRPPPPRYSPPPPPPSRAPLPSHPEIDTSDLPGFH